MNDNSINKDNISLLNRITWYNLNEHGYIKESEFLKKQSAIYIQNSIF